MKSLQWFHLISKSWAHLSRFLGKGSWRQWGQVSIYSKPWAPWEVRAFSLLSVDKSHPYQMSEHKGSPQILPLPPPPAQLASLEKEDMEKFTINSGLSKPFNNGLTSCSNTPLFKTPTPRPVCSVHFPQLPSIYWRTHIDCHDFTHVGMFSLFSPTSKMWEVFSLEIILLKWLDLVILIVRLIQLMYVKCLE